MCILLEETAQKSQEKQSKLVENDANICANEFRNSKLIAQFLSLRTLRRESAQNK